MACVNTLTSITVREAVDEALIDELVYIRGCIPLLFTTEEVTIKPSYIFTSETLDNEDDDVLLVRKASFEFGPGAL